MERRQQHSVLTPRQLECLRVVAEGETAKGVARRLGISSETVRGHLRDARARLGVRTNAAAVYRLTQLP